MLGLLPNEWFSMLICALALRCAYSVAATAVRIADSLDRIQLFMLDRNQNARDALEELRRHHNSIRNQNKRT
jgi:hypothetical protein